MRNAFATCITKLAKEREDIVLLSGDIGNRMFDDFKNIAPNRFINCGIAEANMMSLAAGMALSGLRPMIYTITPFTTTRCLEQIKIGAAYHQANIIIVGTGSGLSYAELGPTHHSLEDIAILRSIPGIRILAPADSNELTAQLEEAVNLSGPTYIRIGKKGEPSIHHKNSKLGIGKGQLLKEGDEILLLGIGPIINEALKASETLAKRDKNIAIATLGGIEPIDSAFLKLMIKRNFHTWITLEEHSIRGGLGTTILEWIADNNFESKVKVKRIGAPHKFIHKLGNQEYTRNQIGIDNQAIISLIENL